MSVSVIGLKFDFHLFSSFFEGGQQQKLKTENCLLMAARSFCFGVLNLGGANSSIFCFLYSCEAKEFVEDICPQAKRTAKQSKTSHPK